MSDIYSVKGAPGSPKAIRNGCICPVLDNAHGAGIGGDGDRWGWWINGSCPVHKDDRYNGINSYPDQ